MRKKKLMYTIISAIFIFIFILVKCFSPKKDISNKDIEQKGTIQINSSNKGSNKDSTENKVNKENKVKKVDGNKIYLENDEIVDISKYSLLGSTPISAIKNNPEARLFFFKYDNKDMCYIYEKPIKEDVTVNEDLNGTTIEGILNSKTESSLQILDDNAYTVSLNCIVYDSNNDCKDYRDIVDKLDTDILIKALIVDKEVVNIKIF